MTRHAALAALVALTTAAGGCTSGEPAPHAEPSTPGAAPSGSTGTAAPSAEELLRSRLPGLGPGAVTGSGQLEEAIATTLPGRPTRDGTVRFVFTCTGASVLSVSVREAGSPAAGGTGSYRCGDGPPFSRSFPARTGSELSFRADATTLAGAGSFAFAFIGDIR